MKKINEILEKIEELSYAILFNESFLESVLTEDLDRIARDMWRRTERVVKTNKNPEMVMKKVIKLTQVIATKAGYKKQDVIKWYYDELADEKIPNKRGKIWHDFFAKEYKVV